MRDPIIKRPYGIVIFKSDVVNAGYGLQLCNYITAEFFPWFTLKDTKNKNVIYNYLSDNKDMIGINSAKVYKAIKEMYQRCYN